MSVLIVCPDYASHYFPLSALGAAWRDAGVEVVVATGPHLAERVRGDGFVHRELILGAGHNPGLAKVEEQRQGEDDHLQAFFDATREGMIPTLAYQARGRLHDLLWRPEAVAERLREIVDEVQPRRILSDQISFSATVALEALGRPYASFVTGHPESLPGPGELYGFPAAVPERFRAPAAELAELRALCRRVRDRFTAEFNRALRRLAPGAPEVDDAFAVTSRQLTLFNYPERLAERRRSALPPTARFLGSAVRDEADAELEAELAQRPTGRPSTSASAASSRPAATRWSGSSTRCATQPSGWSSPRGWPTPNPGRCRHTGSSVPSCPRWRCCGTADLVISHGGNNTVTEALAAGLPLLVGPFSTDQFAVAADLESHGLGEVFDPNRSTPEEIARRVAGLLDGEHRRRARALGAELRRDPGPRRAIRYCREALPPATVPV